MIIRFIRYFCFIVLVVIAVLLATLRLFILTIHLYKNDLERVLSDFIDTTVTIETVSATMHRFYPEIILQNITLFNKANPSETIILKELRISINLLDVLLNDQIMQSLRVSLVGAKLSVIRQKDGRFSLLGLKTDGGEGQPLWLLQGQYYQLINSEISWLNKKRQGKTVTFKKVNLLIKNDPLHNRHQAFFLSYLPSEYGKKLRITIDIKGNVFEPNSLNGKVFVQGENIEFAKLLTGELPFEFTLKKGQGTFKAWGEIKNSELRGLKGNIHAKNLNLRRKNHQNLNFTSIKGRFNWASEADNWKLKVADLFTNIGRKKLKKSDFFLHYQQNNRSEKKISAEIGQIDLRLLSQFSPFFSPWMKDNVIAKKNIAITGMLTKGRIFADLAQQHYALKVDFKHLTITGLEYIPKLSNLSGSIQGTDKKGYLTLNSRNMILKTDKIFRKSLKLSQLKGRLHWRQSAHQWFLNTEKFSLKTPYFNSQHTMRLQIFKSDASSLIDLQTHFGNINAVEALKRYYPVTLMDKDLLNWLDNAFVKGEISAGRLHLSGHLDDFPFDKKEGVFNVDFHLNDLELAYADLWPNFKAIQAEVSFSKDSVAININQAQSEGLSVKNVQAKIASLSEHAELFIKAQAKTDIMAGLKWLKNTPLILPIDTVLEQLTVKGNTEVNLNLKIPLSDDGNEKVQGTLKLNHASIHLKALDLSVDAIKGIVSFDEKGFYSDTLIANVFDSPITAQLRKNAAVFKVDVKGNVASEQLRLNFKSPWLNLAQGKTDYQLNVRIPSNENQETQVKIQSNLQGISLKLPKGLQKKQGDKRPLTIAFPVNNQTLLPIRLSYNKTLQARVKIDKTQQKLHSAHVRWGQGAVKFLSQPEIYLQINQPRLAPLDWMRLINHQKTPNNNTLLPLRVDLKTPQLFLEDKNLGAVHLKLNKDGANLRGNFQSTLLSGKFNGNKDEYNLNLDFVDLSKLATLKFPVTKKTQPVFKKLPLIQVYSKKILWRGVDLGRLNISSQREGHDVYFDSISLSGNDYSLLSVGHWRNTQLGSQTQIEGRFKAETFGKLLHKLNVSKDLKETLAQIDVNLNWQKPPYDFSFSELNGKVGILLEQGRISSIEPGVGRMLGVLAMEQWIKRFQLDFRDIYEKGLRFNHIKGDYHLYKGLAHTDGLIIDAIPAKIILKGDIDLGKQWIDTEISIIPKSSEALPIAGKIMGTIATTIAQTVTGEYEEGFYLRTKYQVQGSWTDLKMTSLRHQDGFLHQVWRGLTDFSWVVN